MHTTREILKGEPEEPEALDTEDLRCPRCSNRVPRMHRYCGFCGHNLSGTLPAQAAGDPLVGAVVGGRYRLMGKIGAGGMGAVYKVEHVQMGKIMAMKLLHGDLSRDETMIRRFNREGRAVSRLTSMHTVQVFDYGQSDGLVYLVMEFLKGRDLGHLMSEMGPLSSDRCIEITLQICKALAEAHVKGVTHRDLKPENVFLCAPQGGQELVKVLDFGLAKLSEREELGAQTLGGSLIGTPFYMSPEQISGGEVGPHSDIYGLGTLMFKLVTGDPPFMAKHPMAVLTAHLSDPIPKPSERFPERAEELRRLDKVITRAMQKRAGDRYESVLELARALKEELPEKTEFSPSPVEDSEGWYEPDALSEPDHVISTRADWVRFERSLKWRRLLSGVLFTLLCLGAGYALWWGLMEDNFFKRDLESEPNNRTLNASALTLGQPIAGTIGLGADGQRADWDFFQVRFDGKPGRVLDIELTGVEGLDLVVETFDIGGQRLALSNGGRVGDGESLRDLLWSGSPVFVLIREVWTEGIPARSAPDRPYKLVVTSRARTRDGEVEPNGLVKNAQAMRSGERRMGAISDKSDVDLYALPPIPVQGQMLLASLEVPEGQDLALDLVDGSGTTIETSGLLAGAEERRVEVFVAPMGRQPLHLGVRAAETGEVAKADRPYVLNLSLVEVGEHFQLGKDLIP